MSDKRLLQRPAARPGHAAYNVFTPEHIQQMDVALANLCAAAAGAQASPELRQDLAAQILSVAKEGERDSVELYIRCLQQRGLWARSWSHNL